MKGEVMVVQAGGRFATRQHRNNSLVRIDHNQRFEANELVTGGLEIHREADGPGFLLNIGIVPLRLTYLRVVGDMSSATGPTTHSLLPGMFVELTGTVGHATIVSTC